jgi:hypothetical protein
MSAEGWKYPEWQDPLQELILEFDDEKAREKGQKVESLILARLQKLRPESDGRGELLALSDALSVLRIVKRNRL